MHVAIYRSYRYASNSVELTAQLKLQKGSVQKQNESVFHQELGLDNIINGQIK